MSSYVRRDRRSVTDPLNFSASTSSGLALGYTPENLAKKGVANGYPPLDGTGKVPAEYLPTDPSGPVADSAQVLAWMGF